MKKILLGSLMLLLPAGAVSAQDLNRKNKSHFSATAKMQKAVKENTASNTVTLTSTAAYPAYGAGNRLPIADPTGTNFNAKASGAIIPSGLFGMPKGTYGFAHGKIFLRSTTAFSTGGSYGSGAVGTGTSINGAGTSEATIGVNGKNPYAGAWLWGDPQPVPAIKSPTPDKQ